MGDSRLADSLNINRNEVTVLFKDGSKDKFECDHFTVEGGILTIIEGDIHVCFPLNSNIMGYKFKVLDK